VRAILVILLVVGALFVALVLAWPHCLVPAACSSALSRNRWLLGGVLGGGAILVWVAMWGLRRREGLGEQED